MKNLLAGKTATCTITYNVDCGGGTKSYTCDGAPNACQDFFDGDCDTNNCCDNVDCV